METTKLLKHDAVVNLPIGSAFYVKLKELLMFMAGERTEEELLQLQDAISNQKEVSEEWMIHFTTLAMLIRAIEDKADKDGLLEDRVIEAES